MDHLYQHSSYVKAFPRRVPQKTTIPGACLRQGVWPSSDRPARPLLAADIELLAAPGHAGEDAAKGNLARYVATLVCK